HGPPTAGPANGSRTAARRRTAAVHQPTNSCTSLADTGRVEARHLAQQQLGGSKQRPSQSRTGAFAQAQVEVQQGIDTQMLQPACVAAFGRAVREEAALK